MKKQNDYTPAADRNGFLTKTILSFLKLFRHFHVQKNENLSVRRAGLRTLLVLALIILISVSHNYFVCGTVTALFLICLCFTKTDVLKRILCTGLSAAFFTALVMLPAFFIYKSTAVITVSLKVFLSTGMLSLYAQVTPWNKITAALRSVRFSGFIIFILLD